MNRKIAFIMIRIINLKLFLIAAYSLLLSVTVFSQTAVHPWHVSDNGGGRSTSGSVTLRSSWGQAGTDEMTATVVTLESGYLPGARQLSKSISITAPAAPVLSSPADNAIDISVAVRLSWHFAVRASTYQLQVSTDSSFNTTVMNDSSLTDTSSAVPALMGNTPYYWRVRARNVAGSSAWSDVWRFTTSLGVPSVPNLAFPPSGSVNQPVTLSIRWHSILNSFTYYVQVATDSTFSSGVITNDSTVTDTVYLLNNLTNDFRYFWRTRAKNAGGTGPWSAVWNFTTIVTLPNQVSLVSPRSNELIESDTVIFVWYQGSPKVSRYWLEYAIDSLFNFKQIDSNVVETFYQRGGLSNGVYWWRVRAYNYAGWGTYSNTWKFNVSVTDVTEEFLLPKNFGLEQNYPNPFNPVTIIRYQLPVESHVTLKIYNMLGQEMATLVDGMQEAGYKYIEFDASALPSGIYAYKLTAGEFTETKRMLLIK